MKLEVFNGEFYKKAAVMAENEEIKNMFNDLSRVEFMHALVHKKIGGFKELPVLRDIDYSRLNSDELLIEAANKREKHAVAYYDKYMDEVKDENIVLVLKALATVEKEHIEMTV
jgi:rubrerythrin